MYKDYELYISEKFDVSYEIPKQELRELFKIEFRKNQGSKTYSSDPLEIPSVILDINNDYIILHCLVDIENKKFQRRKFSIEPFKGLGELVEGDGIIITIETNVGERSFKFRQDNNIKFLFKEPEDRFSKFAGTPLFPNW
jgi:hypothetical protein